MNMQNLMAQAQKLQKEIQQKQKEIDETVFDGESEWVNLTMTGKREIKSLNIKKGTINDDDDLEMLEDMVTLAVNDVLKKIEAETSKKLGAYGQGLGGLM